MEAIENMHQRLVTQFQVEAVEFRNQVKEPETKLYAWRHVKRMFPHEPYNRQREIVESIILKKQGEVEEHLELMIRTAHSLRDDRISEWEEILQEHGE